MIVETDYNRYQKHNPAGDGSEVEWWNKPICFRIQMKYRRQAGYQRCPNEIQQDQRNDRYRKRLYEQSNMSMPDCLIRLKRYEKLKVRGHASQNKTG